MQAARHESWRARPRVMGTPFQLILQMYLSKFENAFVSIFNCICLYYEMYLSMRECAARELASSAADHENTSSHFFNHI